MMTKNGKKMNLKILTYLTHATYNAMNCDEIRISPIFYSWRKVNELA